VFGTLDVEAYSSIRERCDEMIVLKGGIKRLRLCYVTLDIKYNTKPIKDGTFLIHTRE
jgi:hypothetical protein